MIEPHNQNLASVIAASGLFDRDWYLAANADVRIAGEDPLEHYIRMGAGQGRRPSPKFEPNLYLAQLSADERRSVVNPVAHYYLFGKELGLRVDDTYDEIEDGPARGAIVNGVDNGRPTLLMILHDFNGGTAKHVRDLSNLCAGEANVLWLVTERNASAFLYPAVPRADLKLHFDVRTQWYLLVDTLRDCHVGRVHIHHFIGGETFLRRLVCEIGAPFDFTLHDYYVLSPQPHLVGKRGCYVGESWTAAEETLLEGSLAPERPRSLQDWQREHAWLLTEASRVIVPSEDLCRRLKARTRDVESLSGLVYADGVEARLAPRIRDIATTVAAHPQAGRTLAPARTNFPGPEGRLSIALLNAAFPHKGLDVLMGVADLAHRDSAPIEFHLYGYLPVGGPELEARGVKVMGPYEAAKLTRLMEEAGANLLWYPAQCPESFSYTLSEGLQLDLPLVVPTLGAFAERVVGRPWTWVMPWNLPPEKWLKFFLDIREKHFLTGTPPATDGAAAPPLTDEFYRSEYLRPLTRQVH